MARHDIGIDSKALILACNELSIVYIDDDDDTEPLYGGDWRAIRMKLRAMVEQHNIDFHNAPLTDDSLQRMRVKIERTD